MGTNIFEGTYCLHFQGYLKQVISQFWRSSYDVFLVFPFSETKYIRKVPYFSHICISTDTKSLTSASRFCCFDVGERVPYISIHFYRSFDGSRSCVGGKINLYPYRDSDLTARSVLTELSWLNGYRREHRLASNHP
jgi:hypothetical protein